MKYQKTIEKLGYTAKEAKVYLAALCLGESHISDIAAKVKMPRSSVQVIVEKLHKNGLMNFYVTRRYKYWVAENPKQLLEDLKKREETIKEALPELIAMRNFGKNNGKRFDKTYTESLKMFAMFAETCIQPVLVTNGDAEIEFVNKPWQEQFGYTLKEVQGENPRLFHSGKTPQSVYKRLWGALTSGLLFQSDEIIDKRKDGTFFNLLTTIFPIKHANRTFYIQILDDLAEKKRVGEIHHSFVQMAEKSIWQ